MMVFRAHGGAVVRGALRRTRGHWFDLELMAHQAIHPPGVFNFLEQQGRRTILAEAVISTILDQVMAQINFDALECKEATAVTVSAIMSAFSSSNISTKEYSHKTRENL
ncbi:hypothetical protein KIN20_000321 [Parelaphostrongylus tenuis]|uniref:Uncharacterized protein n=1 Tax=Parelaphostrongylus tenuis TaxID=148309 RepID=A0AAD5LUK8_PARTN|nr:hypothetical protein KIN20_000321 [Parelaphostrongylus tenuis]